MRGDFRIGDRTVIPTLNQILHEGNALRVEPKAMRVLLSLAARHGEVAGREELIREVWPDTFVTDDVLKRCVSDLRKALGDDRQTPRFIQTIPKVGYRLLTVVEPVEPRGEAESSPAPVSLASPTQHEITEQAESQTALPAPAAPSSRHRGRAFAAATAAIVIIAAAPWLLRSPAAPDFPAMRVVPLTGLNGAELWPTLSPDGEQVAFSWDDPKEGHRKDGWDHFDIYLKLVGSPEVRRLTTDPGRNWPGGWSPDGHQIACLNDRAGADGTPQPSIYLISPATGVRRKLLDFPATGPPTWTPDGRGLIVAGRPTAPNGNGIYFITVDGGAPPRLVTPQFATAVFLRSAALAPDGHHLAYLACEEIGCACCALSVVELDERWQAVSTPRRLVNQLEAWGGLAWSADGESVLYSAGPAHTPWTQYLWRAWVRGDRAPERLEVAGLGAHMPALASARNRLAFVRWVNSVGVYTLEATPRPVLISSVWDFQPQFSPDGARLVFTSSRSGEGLEIWLASADGSGPHQLTRGPGRYQGSPSWSPDGRQIAFDSRDDDGRLSIWTIDADGGAPRLVTRGPDDRNTPTWSRDGRWIYFNRSVRDLGGSGRSGFLRKEGNRSDTWRVPIAGGSPERVTREGSELFAVESMDGKDLIYKQNFGDAPLLAQPLAGGASRQLLPCVSAVNFAVGDAGIYYAACGPGPERSMHLLDKAGRDRVLGNVGDVFGFELLDRPAVAPDGTVLIHRQSLSNDLMLIENFR